MGNLITSVCSLRAINCVFSMSSCMATSRLVHNGKHIQKLVQLFSSPEILWFGRLYLVTKVLLNLDRFHNILVSIQYLKLWKSSIMDQFLTFRKRVYRDLKEMRTGINDSQLNFAFFGLDFGLSFDTISFKLISNTDDAFRCEINSSKAKPSPPASMFSPYRQNKHSHVETNSRENGWTIARRHKKEWAFKFWLKPRAIVN